MAGGAAAAVDDPGLGARRAGTGVACGGALVPAPASDALAAVAVRPVWKKEVGIFGQGRGGAEEHTLSKQRGGGAISSTARTGAPAGPEGRPGLGGRRKGGVSRTHHRTRGWDRCSAGGGRGSGGTTPSPRMDNGSQASLRVDWVGLGPSPEATASPPLGWLSRRSMRLGLRSGTVAVPVGSYLRFVAYGSPKQSLRSLRNLKGIDDEGEMDRM